MNVDHTYTILLADDDPEDRLLFKEALDETRMGALVTARDGLELMNTLSRMPELPDVIFLDLNMPRKNGHECLREIKNNTKFGGIPVVIYSTSRSEAQIDATYKEGANLYVTKPDSFSLLKKLVRQVLSLKCSDFSPQPDRKHFVFAAA
jgi:CheY-like chemotaxis protein